MPVIEEGDVFKMTVWYDDAIGSTFNGGLNGGLNQNEERILEILRSEFGLNAVEISERMKKSVRTVERYLSSLVKQNLIEFKGAKKTGGYFLIETKSF